MKKNKYQFAKILSSALITHFVLVRSAKENSELQYYLDISLENPISEKYCTYITMGSSLWTNALVSLVAEGVFRDKKSSFFGNVAKNTLIAASSQYIFSSISGTNEQCYFPKIDSKKLEDK